jgi:hypothetical protein
MSDNNMPNATSAATVTPVVPSMDSIAAKMDAMRSTTQRNQLTATEQPTTGSKGEAEARDPVDHSSDAGTEVDDTGIFSDEDRIADLDAQDSPEPTVSPNDANSNAEDIIDFIEFAETNPNAKFKFMRNGKEMMIDAKKAAAILGQGGAIHEDSRQLKIQKSEFDEYVKEQQARQEGLTLAMEFTVQPRLQEAYDEIVKTQGYQTVFQQQLAQAQDPAAQARIRANMEQNERYIQSQSQVIAQLKPAIDQFQQVRRSQVAERLEQNRKNFKDKELKNSYVFNEVREKVAKLWPASREQIVPGIENIDLISSDEALLSLVRDGLKFRDRPKATSAAGNITSGQARRNTAGFTNRGPDDNIAKLREQAKSGDKRTRESAGDNLLMAQLSRLRATRGGR